MGLHLGLQWLVFLFGSSRDIIFWLLRQLIDHELLFILHLRLWVLGEVLEELNLLIVKLLNVKLNSFLVLS